MPNYNYTIRINCYDGTMDDTEALALALHSLKYWREKDRKISSQGHEQNLRFLKRGVSTQCRSTKGGVSISIYPEDQNHV